MTTDLSHVLQRFSDNFPARIDCDKGWYTLILELDAELSEIDPDYTIDQVKEKFGTLRYYYNTSTKRGRLMDSVVSKYEKLSASTCEISGKHGVLMENAGYYRTLNIEHAPDGFKPVHKRRGTPLLPQSRWKEEHEDNNNNQSS